MTQPKANLFATNILMAVLWLSTAHADVSVQWQQTTHDLARQVLERSNIVSDFTQVVDDNFSTESGLLAGFKVSIVDGGIPDVVVSPPEIVIPYQYITDSIKAQAELEETRQAALVTAIDKLEYTLYHLFGHLLASDNSPDADDHAESLSAWLMIKSFPNGGEQWFENAKAFGRASQFLDGPLNDYWHSHSLYKARRRQMDCWVLGSDPAKYEALFKRVLKPQERRQKCVGEWKLLDDLNKDRLKEVLKSGSLLKH